MAHNVVPPTQIRSIQLKHVRCFSDLTLSFNHAAILLQADNGVGKTTILESLYYLCYLRSFRSHRPRDMVQFNTDNFFMQIRFDTYQSDVQQTHTLQAGFSQGTRRVVLDNKRVSSYHDLMTHYRVISITEHDLAIITGSPHDRRSFIDHMIVLENPHYMDLIRRFRTVLEQRNSFMLAGARNTDMYDILTEQLYMCTQEIQHERKVALEHLINYMQQMGDMLGMDPFQVSLAYDAKVPAHASYAESKSRLQALKHAEIRMGRSLFGAHLDDIAISFAQHGSRHYASRGQQKLIVLMIKIAQLQRLSDVRGGGILLLDDFMTDFDYERIDRLSKILFSLPTQLIFTSPVSQGPLQAVLGAYDVQVINL